MIQPSLLAYTLQLDEKSGHLWIAVGQIDLMLILHLFLRHCKRKIVCLGSYFYLLVRFAWKSAFHVCTQTTI